MSNLQQRGIIAIPKFSVWTARRKDKIVTADVAQRNKAEARRAGNYTKYLVNPEDPIFKAPGDIVGEARRYHYVHTFPWTFEGAAILSTGFYEEYGEKFTRSKYVFDEAVGLLIENIPFLKAQAKADLGSLWREADFPSQFEIENKFSFSVKFYPVPTEGDFRANLDDDDIKVIKSQLREELRSAEKDVVAEKWVRLSALLKNVVTILSVPNAKPQSIKDSLIRNIQEAVVTLPKLALDDDPKFDAAIEEVTKQIASVHPQALRDDNVLRDEVARKAAAIAKKMAAYAAA